MSRRVAGASTAVVGALLAGLAGVFVVRTLVAQWDEVRDSLDNARAGWLVVAGLLAAGGMTAIAFPWRRAVRLLGGEMATSETVARYYLGEIGKYLPGGVWPVVGRGELARRAGVPRGAAYGSVALSLAALYLSAMFLVVLGLPAILGEGDPGGHLWVVALLPLGVLALHHKVLERAKGMVERARGRSLTLTIPAWRDTLVLIGLYVPAWLLIGSATWAVARGLGQDVGWLEVAPAAVLSWVVGFVLVPVPGGVGVREAAFIAAAGALDGGVGAAVAVVARALFVLVDAVGAAVASGWLARRRVGGAASSGSEHADAEHADTVAVGEPAAKLPGSG